MMTALQAALKRMKVKFDAIENRIRHEFI